jgi:phenylacetate-CoA ligase
MKFRERLSQSLLLPIGMNVKNLNYRKTRDYALQLMRDERKDYTTLTENRNDRFRKMIQHCHNNVPYYRRIMDERGLTEKDFQSIDDVVRLPILDKKTLIAQQKYLMAQNVHPKNIRIECTGGSTGRPTPFGIDLNNYYQIFANAWRFWGYTGYKPGMKMLLFWGNYRELEQQSSLKNRIKSFIENTFLLNTYDLSPEKAREYAKIIQHQRPTIIRGFAGALYLFVEICKKYNFQVTHHPQAVITTAENITNYQKQKIKEFFETAVFEEYGSREFGIMAHECTEHSGLHLAEEQFIFEVFNPHTNLSSFKGRGELVISSLFNYCMPLLRYRIEDEGEIISNLCACGRVLPILKQISGRITDYVVTKNGNLLSEYILEDFFEIVPEISSFQIQQFQKGEVDILLVLDDNFDMEMLGPIRAALNDLLQNDLNINIRKVDKIDLLPSGKRQTTKSYIVHEYLPTTEKPGFANSKTTFEE